MNKYTMVVSKKENNSYVEVGKVAIFYPLLSELGIAVDPTHYEKKNDKGEAVKTDSSDSAALPVYADDKIAFAFDAVFAAVKATARNRLQSGTATLKPDNKIAETLEELLESGERSGEALKNRRDFFAGFKAFLATLGKSAAYAQGVYDIAFNTKGLPYQSQARKDTVKTLVAQYGATLKPEDVLRYERTISAIDEQASQADPLSE